MSYPNSSTLGGVNVQLGLMTVPDPGLHTLLHADNANPFQQQNARFLPFVVGEVSTSFCGASSDLFSSIATAELTEGDVLLSAHFACDLFATPAGSSAAMASFLLKETMYVWTPAVGIAMIEEAKLLLNSNENETLTDMSLLLHEELCKPDHMRQGEAIGDYGLYLRGGATLLPGVRRDEDTIQAARHFSSCKRKIYTELPFSFTRDPSWGLWLVATQKTKVEIRVKLRPVYKLGVKIEQTKSCINPTDVANYDAAAVKVGDCVVTATTAGDFPNSKYMDNARIVTCVAHVNDAMRATMSQRSDIVRQTYLQVDEIEHSASHTATLTSKRSYVNNPVASVMIGYRSKENEDKNLWCQLGAYRAHKVLAGRLSNAANTGATVPIYHDQEVVDHLERIELKVNNSSLIDAHPEHKRLVETNRKGFGAPRRVCYRHDFGTSSGGKKELLSGDSYLNHSLVDASVWYKYHKSVSTGGAPDIEKIGKFVPNAADVLNASFDLTNVGLQGKTYIVYETLGWYKQAVGYIAHVYVH